MAAGTQPPDDRPPGPHGPPIGPAPPVPSALPDDEQEIVTGDEKASESTIAPRCDDRDVMSGYTWLSSDIAGAEGPAEDLASVAHSIPGYEILGEIHRGGQGVVYQAIQKNIGRRVAIKIMREGPFASRRDKARFEREVQILAALRHPNLVAVHDSGQVHGNFYYVMDYISGQPLDLWMSGAPAPIQEVLQLFARICDAVNAAHLRGVIHRDLKPSNICIGSEGEPHILDFGLAKMATAELTDDSRPQVMTLTGQFVGSLPWASPEQAEGMPAKIDTRTDVYSLGVILFQMLTGAFPYAVTGAMHDVLNNILTREPCRPGSIRKQIDNEIETIVLKCLDKQRERRYQTAGELARDIRRYLAGEPVEAKPDPWYVLMKHLRRYRGPVAAVLGFVLMLALGLAVSLTLWRRSITDRDRAREAEILAQQGERKARLAYANGAIKQGTALHLAGDGAQSRAAFLDARRTLYELGASTLPADVALYRSYRDYEAPIRILSGHSAGLMAVAWFPDGCRACSASEDGTIRLWDVKTGREISRPLRGHAGIVTSVAVSPNGRYIVSAGEEGIVLLWDLNAPEAPKARFVEPAEPVRGVAFSPDGRLVLSASAKSEGTVKLWDLQTGQLVRSFPEEQKEAYYGVAFSPDGRRVVASTYGGAIRIWETHTGRMLQELTGHTSYVISAVFSPDGTRVLSASFDQTVRLWDLKRGQAIQVFKGHTEGVRGAAFVDGQTAISCSMDHTLKLWDLETGAVLRTFAGHADGVRGVAVSPDRRRAISAGIDGRLNVWSLESNSEARTVEEGDVVTSLSVTPDGHVFVSGTASGCVRLRDLATFQVLKTFRGRALPIDSASVLPGGRRLFTANNAGDAVVWDVASGKELQHFAGKGPGETRDVRGKRCCVTALAQDGRFSITSNPDATIEMRDLETGGTSLLLPAHRNTVRCIAISPDGAHALCGDTSGRVYYWDLQQRACLASLPTREKSADLDCLAFSADGKLALAGGHGLTVQLWDLTVRPMARLREFEGPTLVVEAVAFGRDGRTVFSAGRDMTLRIWDVRFEDELSLPAHFPAYCYALTVVPPGDAVLVASGSMVTLWDISRFARYLQLDRQVEEAGAILQDDPTNPTALAALGRWYAFRGIDDWAIEFFEQARAGGETVSPLTLARCYWRLGRNSDAAREFQSAMARNEAPRDYLTMCLATVETAPTSGPTETAVNSGTPHAMPDAPPR